MAELLTAPGLSFELTDEQRMFQRTIRDLVESEFAKSYCREVEAREDFPWDLWQKFGKFGLTSIGLPEEHGGQGGGLIEQVIVDEELSRTLAGLYWLLGITLFDGKAIATSGTEEQKQRFLPEIAAGRMMCAISMTEPSGGTDALGAMKTTARRTRGGWIVRGTKMWSTLAHVADRLFLVARTNADVKRPSEGITVFFCDAHADGVTATPIPKLGMRSLGSCEIQLEDVFVPDDDVLGEVDRGWTVLANTLNSERIMNGANCTGALAGVLEDMVAYAKTRIVFGKPLGQMQAVQHMIADTYAGLEISRLLTYRAAWLHSLGRPCGVESTMAKLVASEQCFAGADRGMQVLGGYGYALEYDMQRYWRDMRLYRVAPINNEMARNFLAESLGFRGRSEAMDDDGSSTVFVSDSMRNAVGRELRRLVSYPISSSDVRRWALATYYPEIPPRLFWDADHASTTVHGGIVAPEEFNPFAWMTADPPGFRPSAAGGIDFIEDAIGIAGPGLKHSLNGGLEARYGVRMRPGDVITSITTLAGYYERTGRLGRMLFTVTDSIWSTQHGDEVKRLTATTIRY